MPPPDEPLYDLYVRGMAHLERHDYAQATVALEKVARRDPQKSSVREALGRAYFHLRRYRAAADEFAAVVERHPVNHYAHFCLGRSLSKAGRAEEARAHLALAANLRPDRADYRRYRDAARSA